MCPLGTFCTVLSTYIECYKEYLRKSVVGITTLYSLFRKLVGLRISAAEQTGTGAHTVFTTMRIVSLSQV